MTLFKKLHSKIRPARRFKTKKNIGSEKSELNSDEWLEVGTEWGRVKVYDAGNPPERAAQSESTRHKMWELKNGSEPRDAWLDAQIPPLPASEQGSPGEPRYLAFVRRRMQGNIFFQNHRAAISLKLCLLFAGAFCAGHFSASFVHRNDPPAVYASADGNWGLSFQQEGKPPVANATFDELKQYDAYYAENTQEKVLYLTFDAGFENGSTPAILDALKKHKAPATFFVVGNYIETSPDLIKRMIAEGHTVGNHTYHHPDMSKISTKEAFSKELTDLETLYQQTTGQAMTKFYRPPQGKYSEVNLKMAQDLGYKTFFWSLAYVDWYQDKQPTKEEAFKKLLGRIHPGAVVLLHSTSSTNAQILDELLTKWEEMGYTFKALGELAG